MGLQWAAKICARVFSSVVRTEPHFVRNLCGAGDGAHGLHFSGRAVVLLYFAVGSGARICMGCVFSCQGDKTV